MLSLEVAMLHQHPYEAIDETNGVSKAQKETFDSVVLTNLSSNRHPETVRIAGNLQEFALRMDSEANLKTPSLVPPTLVSREEQDG